MAIRFACPSCRQPIEIDDQWAGQSVACPYCKRVVTAPPSSTWPPPGEVPMATPARSAFEPPPPPSGMAPARVEDYRRASGAPAALTLAIFSAALAALGVLVWITLLMERVEEQLGAKAGGVHVREISHQELQEAVQKVLTSGNVPRSPLASGALLIGTVSGLMALVLAVRSLLRQEPRRGMAIAACIISTAFLFCQMGILLMMSVSHAPR